LRAAGGNPFDESGMWATFARIDMSPRKFLELLSDPPFLMIFLHCLPPIWSIADLAPFFFWASTVAFLNSAPHGRTYFFALGIEDTA